METGLKRTARRNWECVARQHHQQAEQSAVGCGKRHKIGRSQRRYIERDCDRPPLAARRAFLASEQRRRRRAA